MRSRRLVVFLGVFSILNLILVSGSGLLVQLDVLRARGHLTLGWAGILPIAAYLLLSLRWIARARIDEA